MNLWIRFLSIGGSYSSFEEDIKGSIESRKLADMVVLSDDIFKVESHKIKDIEVEMTIFNGKIMYNLLGFRVINNTYMNCFYIENCYLINVVQI